MSPEHVAPAAVISHFERPLDRLGHCSFLCRGFGSQRVTNHGAMGLLQARHSHSCALRRGQLARLAYVVNLETKTKAHAAHTGKCPENLMEQCCSL